MAECRHVFIGKADGVHCTRCGRKLTPAEYAAGAPAAGALAGGDPAPEARGVHPPKRNRSRNEKKRAPAAGTPAAGNPAPEGAGGVPTQTG